MNADERRLNEITEQIIGYAYNIANGLRNGFLEKVYENSMFVEVTQAGLKAKQQVPVIVRWRNVVVGEYCADLIVDAAVLVELRACKALDDVHVAQCLNYLKATGLKVCLLIIFGKSKIEIRRIVNNL